MLKNGIVRLPLPTLAVIGATRGLLGLGAGLLIAPKLDRRLRRTVGFALLGIGIASTLPLGLRVFGSK